MERLFCVKFLMVFILIFFCVSPCSYALDRGKYTLLHEAFGGGYCKLLQWDEHIDKDVMGEVVYDKVRSTCSIEIKNKNNYEFCTLVGFEVDVAGHSVKCDVDFDSRDKIIFTTDISKHFSQTNIPPFQNSICHFMCFK